MKYSYFKYGREHEVQRIDPVYRKIQFDAEYMKINGNDVTLFYPKKDLKNEWLYVINGKNYTNVGTNLFVDNFDSMIRSPKILLSHLKCYRDGWKLEVCPVSGDVCVYEFDKYRKITVYINIDMDDGSTQISVGYEDKKIWEGCGGCHSSERSVIEKLNYLFDKYDTKKQVEEVVQKDFELLTLDL